MLERGRVAALRGWVGLKRGMYSGRRLSESNVVNGVSESSLPLHQNRYAGHDKHNTTTSEHVMLDECMNAHKHTRQYLSPKVVAHPAGSDYLVYPVLQTLGIADILHGRNVPFKLIQVLPLHVLMLLPSPSSISNLLLASHLYPNAHSEALTDSYTYFHDPRSVYRRSLCVCWCFPLLAWLPHGRWWPTSQNG